MPGLKIGTGMARRNPEHDNDGNRSCPAWAHWRRYGVAGVSFVGLQTRVHAGPTEIRRSLPIERTGPRCRCWTWAAVKDYLADTTAACPVSRLDLVISVGHGNAPGRRAGGGPCLLGAACRRAHRLALNALGGSNAWYPDALRLFRQAAPGL